MHPYEFMEFVYRFYQHDMTGVPLKFYPLQYRWWNHFDKSQEYKQVDVLRISLNRGLDLARFRSLCDSVCVEVEDVRIRSSFFEAPDNVGLPFNTYQPNGPHWSHFELEFPEIVEWGAVEGLNAFTVPVLNRLTP